MAARVILDVNRRGRVRNTRNGIEVSRQCIVTDIPIDAGLSDAAVLTKCLALPDFPKIFDVHPDPNLPGVAVDEQLIVSVENHKNTVDCDIIYRSPPVQDLGGGALTFVVTRTPQTNWIETYVTSDKGSNLRLWYEPGAATDVEPPTAKSEIINVRVPKMVVTSQLRAVAILTGAQWQANKAYAYGMRRKINNANWGDDPRGKWFCMGPTERTADAGRTYYIEMNFLEAETDWFAVVPWRDFQGNVPADIASEADLRAGGLPAEDGYRNLNGIGIYSIISEGDFSGFSFTP